MAIIHQITRRYANKQEEIVGELIKSTGAISSTDPKAVLKRKAAEVAYLMALLNGGEWRTTIDHDLGFVTISRLHHQRRS